MLSCPFYFYAAHTLPWAEYIGQERMYYTAVRRHYCNVNGVDTLFREGLMYITSKAVADVLCMQIIGRAQ